MFNLDSIIEVAPYSLNKSEKNSLYEDAFFALTQHHYENCEPYGKILNALNIDPSIKQDVDNIPFLPVRIFKEHDLRSVEEPQVIKTMTSSGTSGQRPSKIFLDRDTSKNQTKVLVKVTSSFIGKKRLPMLVIDSKVVLKDRKQFSARGAGILGFSMLGRDVTYVLDENMELDVERVEEFHRKHEGSDILIFGFTFMVWEYFYKKLEELNKKLPLDKAILIHGGGWKKLDEQSVDNNTFKSKLGHVCGIKKVYNYYGMVEQTGSIFMECEAGYLHSSIFSDVITRREDFSICDFNETGVIQLLSLLPKSYPGHSILSEDSGIIHGEDNCQCGRLGKYFTVHGRIESAEIRGCSDTFSEQ
tara:strand:- start:3646 stop:4722 length:1077 start_codon:yes stop_codon:yes gene_type:complete